MKILTLFALIIGSVNAGHISMTFRGLDANYTFTPFAVSTLREIVACRAGLNHSVVLLESIKIKNTTFEFKTDDEVNAPNKLLQYNCHFLNQVHWTQNPAHISRTLLKELLDEVEVTFKLEFPGASEKAYGANIIPFLATSINEYYADILANDYMAFYAGSIPELIRHNNMHGLFKESDQIILFYMFIVQIGLVFIGNIVLNKLKRKVPPLSPAAFRGQNYDPVYVIVK